MQEFTSAVSQGFGKPCRSGKGMENTGSKSVPKTK